ncbi:hypothetical protein PL11201_700089 [Planktothrix sp. PCC 11201]|nr:hypothetical protein PL11201_700089 [Planktothrix sp. PCC 11201]
MSNSHPGFPLIPLLRIEATAEMMGGYDEDSSQQAQSCFH